MHSKKMNAALPRLARQLLLIAVPSCLAVTLLPAQSGSNGMTGNARGSGQPMMHDSVQSVVNLLTIANQDEVQAGTLAASKATRADVKAFAKKLVDDHTTAIRHLTDSASVGGWPVADSTAWASPPGMDRGGMRDSAMRGGMRDSAMRGGNMRDSAMRGGMSGDNDARMLHAANLAAMKKLQDASGANFDQIYLSTQVEGHEMLLKALDRLHTSHVRLGRMVTDLKTTVQQHLAEARRLQSGSGTQKP